MQGIKRKRRCQNQCEEHIFGLKNLKNNSKYDIKLTFCPKYQRQPLPPQHTFAEYNNDGLYYTSAFVLGVDKKNIAKNLQKEMLDHQKLIKQNCQKYNQIVFPRPNSKHTTCSVCKQQYKNYYHHIFSDEHSDKIQLSPYNVFVKQLCQLFRDLWDGCAEKADNDALNQVDRDRADSEKKVSDQLNLDDILEQEDIDSNPSRISKYLEADEDEESEVKQVVMKRPVRVYEPAQVQKPQKVYEDRQSRKKHINFAAFFDDQPKKKIITDHRDAISVTSKKMTKTSSATETKPKDKITPKKQQDAQNEDPFIIEYNARGKRKQKKSYYYLKKKQREERELREKEMLIKQQSEQGITKSKHKVQEEQQQQFSDENYMQNQDEIEKPSEQIYEKYVEDFHEEKEKQKPKPSDLKKTFSVDLKLFEEVQKKPYPAPLFESFANPIKNEEKIQSQKPVPILKESGIIIPEMNLLTSQVYPLRRPSQKDTRLPMVMDKKLNVNNEQKQQISEKNKINYSLQNQLPLFHKFKNPQEKEIPKQNQIKTQKATHEVFNEYEQKIRQYQKQKDYNAKLNKMPQKLNPFQEKINHEIQPSIEESTVKDFKNYPSKDFQQTYRFQGQRNPSEQALNPAQIKTQPYNPAKYSSFSQAYYKKNIGDKQLPNPLSLNPLLPQHPYSSPHQFYPPYNYPISPYGYPIHDPTKTERPPLKYGQQRQNEAYERGYYYGGWQAPYYMPHPPGTVPHPQTPDVESAHKNFAGNSFGATKNETKPVLYPGYPGTYPGYPPAGYPGYYPTSGTPYPTSQRPDYTHPASNMRLPTQPNTSININFPMYLGPPYHSPYSYQHNLQRYPGQQPQNPPSSQYLPSGQPQPQIKPPGPQYGSSFNAGGLSSLPPYAQYQEFKKRTNERR